MEITDKQAVQAIDLLTQLVSIPSPSEEELNAATYLTGWMNSHSLTASIDEAGNAVGVKGDGSKEILLLGHIDTFPGEIPVQREGDILHGRGSVDAKGPLCTFAVAAAHTDVPADWRITVVGAVEEESATSKGARYILKQRLKSAQNEDDDPSLFNAPAFCIIGEPSQWDRITLGYKGRLLMDLTIQAPFSHSAGEGQLPAEQAVDFWQQVKRFCDQINQKREATSPFTRLDPSLRHIVSQDQGSFGLVKMSLGFRLPVGISPPELEEQLIDLLTTFPTETETEVKFSGAELAYKGGKSNHLVRSFLVAIRDEEGRPRFVVKTGTADMNVVAPHWPQTPIVAYGPGDSNLDHTPNEHIDLQEYLRAIGVLKEVLKGLMI